MQVDANIFKKRLDRYNNLCLNSNMTYNLRRIRYMRLVKGWTFSKLAKEIGEHPSTVSRIERGENQNPETVKKIADALGIPMEELVLLDEEEVVAK